jgi:hypothetical protein
MIPPARSTDPPGFGGSIAGPGGPHDRGGVVLDVGNALVPTSIEVAQLDEGPVGAVALLLRGPVVSSGEEASVMVLLGTDAAAAITTELTALYSRMGGEGAQRYQTDMLARIEALIRDGNVGGSEP